MKKIITLALIAAMMLTMIVVGTSAAAWDGTSVSASLKGEGTEASPYLVESAADLAFLAQSVNAGTNYEGKYLTQTADIDLGGKEWTPIGLSAAPFSGVYNGCGFKVTGLSITNKDTDITGLFGYVQSQGVDMGIANLTVEGAITVDAGTKTNNGIGGLVGQVQKSGVSYAKRAYIINCVSDVDVTLTNCTTEPRVGGFAGYGFYAVFENCVNNGNVTVTTSKSTRVAGFVGQTNSSTYKGCVNNGNVAVTINGAAVTRACGITSVITVGPNGDALYTEFVNCVNNGDIVNTVTGTANAYTAGIAGDVYPASGTSVRVKITNCVNTGDLTGNTAAENPSNATYYTHTGGIGAYFGNNNKDIYINGCVNTGTVAYTSHPAAQPRTAGIMGSIYCPDVTTLFELKNCISTNTIKSGTCNIGYKADPTYRDTLLATCVENADPAVAAAAVKTITDANVPSTTKIAGFDTAYKAPAAPETTTPEAPETTVPTTPSTPSTPNTGDVTSIIVLALVATCAGAVLTIKKTK